MYRTQPESLLSTLMGQELGSSYTYNGVYEGVQVNNIHLTFGADVPLTPESVEQLGCMHCNLAPSYCCVLFSLLVTKKKEQSDLIPIGCTYYVCSRSETLKFVSHVVVNVLLRIIDVNGVTLYVKVYIVL